MIDEECDKATKPEMIKGCNLRECSKITANVPMWIPSDWGECSKSCGGGRKKRQLTCELSNSKLKVSNSQCPKATKPKRTVKCNTEKCPTESTKQVVPQWIPSEWSECSNTCGVGVKTRTVHCELENQKLVVDASFTCQKQTKPKTITGCNNGICTTSRWFYSNWSSCSQSCGTGQKTRTRSCKTDAGERSSECDNSIKNDLTQSCNTFDCPKWSTEPWTECSVKCGGGTKKR